MIALHGVAILRRVIVGERVIAEEIFDRLRQATAANPSLLVELCRDYLTEARSTVSQLRNALAEQKAAELRERAHYLKGSSMMIGAQGLSQCCATLEQMGHDSDLAGAAGELERVITALKAVEAELTRALGPVVLPEDSAA